MPANKLHCGDLLELVAVMLKEKKTLIKSTIGEEAE